MNAGLIVFLLFFGLPILIFVVILVKFLGKAKEDEWEGEVVDKKFNERRDMDDNNKMEQFYSVVFKTTDGRTRTLAVTAKDYPTWKVGDKARKIKGKLTMDRL